MYDVKEQTETMIAGGKAIEAGIEARQTRAAAEAEARQTRAAAEAEVGQTRPESRWDQKLLAVPKGGSRTPIIGSLAPMGTLMGRTGGLAPMGGTGGLITAGSANSTGGLAASDSKPAPVKNTRPPVFGDSIPAIGDKAPAYSTLPLSNAATTDPASGVNIPSPAAIREAKDWVDFHEV